MVEYSGKAIVDAESGELKNSPGRHDHETSPVWNRHSAERTALSPRHIVPPGETTTSSEQIADTTATNTLSVIENEPHS
jgi:hypothetical protein